MIGIFDSGFGGLQSLSYIRSLYPQYDYIFLADRKNFPYGSKTPEEIQAHTFAALDWLFAQGAKLVIVACNTAAAYAIRSRQQQFPEKKALSVTVPGVERLVKLCHSHIGVLATQATVMSGVYNDLFTKLGGQEDANLQLVMAPELIDIVESGEYASDHSKKLVKEYLAKFPKKMECLVLWCTHFPALIPLIREDYTGTIIDPAWESAQKLWPYLEKHSEISERLGKRGSLKLYTTGRVATFLEVGKNFLPDIDGVEHVEL